MTLDQFNRLPLLLRRGAVERITGLSAHTIDDLRMTGSLKTTKLRREVRYFRESVRELVGFNNPSIH